MRVTVQHALKIPAEKEYSSRQHSVAMEVDVPADVVQKGKDAIRDYVAAVAKEVRSYVEAALAKPDDESRSTPVRSASRAGPVGRPAARPGARSPSNGNGHENGHAGSGASSGDGEPASLKQLNYIRALAKDAGYTPDQVLDLAEEVTGRAGIRVLSALSKRDCSSVIAQLKGGSE